MLSHSIRLNPQQCPICQTVGIRVGQTPLIPNTPSHTLFVCPECTHKWLIKSVENAISFAEEVPLRESSTLQANWVLNRLPKILSCSTSIRVLDVGCWDGTLLSRLPESWTRHGVELNKKAALIAQSRGLNVFPEPIETLSLKSNYYDLVLMMDVWEHLDNPLIVFQKISDVIRPGGYLFALTGNGNCLGAKLFKGHWYYFNYTEHITFFSPHSAKMALDKVNVETLKIYKLPHHSTSNLLVKKVLNNFIKSSNKEGNTFFLPLPISAKDRLFLMASRLLRGHDHLVILGKKRVK
jgi:2-polyprenyl-3-methyl-5-hydroxy-6-metoxy-1,4-benzoquinol methylase